MESNFTVQCSILFPRELSRNSNPTRPLKIKPNREKDQITKNFSPCTVVHIQSVQKVRSLFLGRLWVKFNSDQCYRSAWAPSLQQAACFLSTRNFCFAPHMHTSSVHPWVFQAGFVQKQVDWICLLRNPINLLLNKSCWKHPCPRRCRVHVWGKTKVPGG